MRARRRCGTTGCCDVDDGTAVVLAASVPAILAFAGVIWQSRKTRHKGTEEHLMAREMLQSIDSKVDQHTGQLERIDGRVERIDARVDRIDSRVDHIEQERPA